MHVNYRRSSSVKLQLKYQTMKDVQSCKCCEAWNLIEGRVLLGAPPWYGGPFGWRWCSRSSHPHLDTPTHDDMNRTMLVKICQRHKTIHSAVYFGSSISMRKSILVNETPTVCRTVWHHPITYARLENISARVFAEQFQYGQDWHQQIDYEKYFKWLFYAR